MTAMSASDPWSELRQFTSARIAIGRTGDSLPTARWLEFRHAHAIARDAVHTPFHVEQMVTELAALGGPVIGLESAAPDRATYLRRPDLGRQLADDSLLSLATAEPATCDLSIIVSDGLSAQAAHRHAPALLAALLPQLTADGWQLAPLTVVHRGRVAIADVIGNALKATLALILLGERPGLGSPDSLGAYFVYQPRPGRTDAERNCVSNIRADGLPPAAAADTLCYLLRQSRQRKLSGVQLKDDRDGATLTEPHTPQLRANDSSE